LDDLRKPTIPQLLPNQADHSENNLVNIGWLSRLIRLPKQGAHVVNYLAGTKSVSYDVIQHFPGFVTLGWCLFEKFQRGTAVHPIEVTG
jgi:hypothetical protein